ncbi:hypothetical protein [Rothia nasimurium]|uniref:hypothetical protein n=1 Tax=Rothia nasimurium TaxID=85336 RepID=UPI001F1BAC65|nr:hypothetical protein [Rothia nasimurium]
MTLPAPVAAKLDAEGRVSASLLVPAADAEPDAWVWEACPQLRGPQGAVRFRDFAFELTEDAPVNLAEVLPVPDPVTGEYVTRGETGADGVGISTITLEDGELVIALTDGSVTRLPAPKGDPGEDGISPPAPTLRVGEVATLPTGSSAVAEITGEAPDYTLTLGVPQGAKGEKGDKGDSIVGPKGEPGNPATLVLVGVGRPDTPSTLSPENQTAVANALVGATFTSTDGAGTGAWAWVKTPGGWQVTYGDTGWRNVVSMLGNGWASTSNEPVYLRRIGPSCTLTFSLAPSNTLSTLLTMPQGFRSVGSTYFGGPSTILQRDGYVNGAIYFDGPTTIKGRSQVTYAHHRGILTWLSSDPWPATLPGAPV